MKNISIIKILLKKKKPFERKNRDLYGKRYKDKIEDYNLVEAKLKRKYSLNLFLNWKFLCQP
jgi:hypothetical protein